MAKKPSVGWAVEVTGERIDLDDLRELLAPPFDPWVEDYEDGENLRLLLRSEAWKSVEDSATVMLHAQKLLERTRGAALMIHGDAQPLALGPIFKFRTDGTRDNILVLGSLEMKLRGGRVRARATVGTGTTHPPPQPSPMQLWLQAADSDDDQADLLDHLARADNWYDIYKAAEIIRRIAGGEAALKPKLGALRLEWRRVWQTASCNRHAPDPVNYSVPPVPGTVEQARALIFRAARLIA